MKWAIYGVAGLMLACLVSVSFSYQPEQPVVMEKKTSVIRQEVYVNVYKLVRLHPRWEVLSEMKATLAEARIAPEALKSPGHLHVSQLDAEHVPDSNSSVFRQTLEAEAGKAAIRALGQLESDRRTAMESRTRVMRETMISSTKADIQAETQKIVDYAGDNERKIAQENSSDRLNAEIRLSALNHALKLQGVRKQELQDKLKTAQAGFDKVTQSTQAETLKIESDTKEKIADLHEQSADMLDAAISIYESGENRRIEEEMTTARDATFKELSLPERDFLNEGKTSAGFDMKPGQNASLLTSDADEAGKLGTAWMHKEISTLESRILQDVKRMVLGMAEKKGVKVVFTRNDADIPDQTQVFYDLMRRSDWSAGGLILSDF